MAPKRPKRGAETAPPRPSAAQDAPYTLFYSPRILTDDLGEIGHAAYENAKKAIQKKLPVAPDQYGDGLGPPLEGIWKLKSSNVRVAYHIEESAREVWVLMIGDRDVIWDRHQDEILGRFGYEGARAAKRSAAKKAAASLPLGKKRSG